MYIVAIFDEEQKILWSAVCDGMLELIDMLSHALNVVRDKEYVRFFKEV